MTSIVVRNVSFFLERSVNGSQYGIVCNSEVPVGVSSCNKDDVVICVGERNLGADVISKGMLHSLHAHALCSIPLPDVHSLIWISIGKRYEHFLSTGLGECYRSESFVLDLVGSK